MYPEETVRVYHGNEGEWRGGGGGKGGGGLPLEIQYFTKTVSVDITEGNQRCNQHSVSQVALCTSL